MSELSKKINSLISRIENCVAISFNNKEVRKAFKNALKGAKALKIAIDNGLYKGSHAIKQLDHLNKLFTPLEEKALGIDRLYKRYNKGDDDAEVI